MKDDNYYLHQTPEKLAKKIIESIEWEIDENVCEPFKGQGAFYDNLPEYVNKSYAEIEEGVDFRDINYDNIDTIITNPPFDIGEGCRIRKNNFYKILLYFANTRVKRVIFLCSATCFNSITPKRYKELKENNLYLTNISVCNVRKWWGRYYLITFTRDSNNLFNFISLDNFE